MKKTIKYLQNGEYHYATVKDVGDLARLKTDSKEDLVDAINELFTTGGSNTSTNDLASRVDAAVTKVNDQGVQIAGFIDSLNKQQEMLNTVKATLSAEQLARVREELTGLEARIHQGFTTDLAALQKSSQDELSAATERIKQLISQTQTGLENLSKELSNASLDYGKVKKVVTWLDDKIGTKLSSTDLDPVKSRITQVETSVSQTKEALKATATKQELDTITHRVTAAESAITETASHIEAGVSNETLATAIDKFESGRENLLLNTRDFSDNWDLSGGQLSDEHEFDPAHSVKTVGISLGSFITQPVNIAEQNVGGNLVVSMWHTKDTLPEVWYGTTKVPSLQVLATKGEWQRSSASFVPTSVNGVLKIGVASGGQTLIHVGEPKLEIGQHATPYSSNSNDPFNSVERATAKLKITAGQVESVVTKQAQNDNAMSELSSRVSQNANGLTVANRSIDDKVTGLRTEMDGKIAANAKQLTTEYKAFTNTKFGEIVDSGENQILNSAFSNVQNRKDKWQNISDRVEIVADGNGLMWAKMQQSGRNADNPIGMTSNYFPVSRGKVTIGVDVRADNATTLDNDKILILETYNASKHRVNFTEVSLEGLGLSKDTLSDGLSHRGVIRYPNDRTDVVYMTVQPTLKRNGTLYFTNFSAKMSSIDNGGYTPNAEDLQQQITQTRITQDAQGITLHASQDKIVALSNNVSGVQASLSDMNAGGGGNLLRGTTTEVKSMSGTNFAVATIGALDDAEPGQTYTVSFEIIDKSQAVNLQVWQGSSVNDRAAYLATRYDVPKGRSSFTFTWPDNGTRYMLLDLCLPVSSDVGSYSWRDNVMLEKGKVAHGWTPASSDTDTKISQATERLRIETKADIKNAGDSITASVTALSTTKIEAAKAALSNQITEAQNAAVNISKGAIVSEVSSIKKAIGDVTTGKNLLIGTSPEYELFKGVGPKIVTTGGRVDNQQAVIDVSANKAGDTFTYSANLVNQGKGPICLAISYLTNDGRLDTDSMKFSRAVDPGTGEVLKSVSITLDGKAKQISVGVLCNDSGAGYELKIKNEKLELGTTATEWVPAFITNDVGSLRSQISQAATGITLMAQQLTGKDDINFSSIIASPDQIKIASNKIIIDGNTDIHGTLNVPKVRLQGKSGFIGLDSDDGLIISSTDTAFQTKYTQNGMALLTTTSDRKEVMGGIFTGGMTGNMEHNGISVIIETEQDLGRPYGGDSFTIGKATKVGKGGVPEEWTAAFEYDASATKFNGGFIFNEPVRMSENAEMRLPSFQNIKVDGTQDPLAIVARQDNNGTQTGFHQPTLMAGYDQGTHGNSGITFYWDSVKAFGSLDLRDTQIFGNSATRFAAGSEINLHGVNVLSDTSTHFGAGTTFNTDGEANLMFTWAGYSDLWNGVRLPALVRSDWWSSPNGSGGIAFANGSAFFVDRNHHSPAWG